MHFQTCELSARFGGCIESMFHFRDFVPDHAVERVVPTGHVFLIFELDGMVRSTFDNQTLAPTGEFTRAWVSGVHRNFISISAHARSEMLVVQFAIGGAYPFLHRPVAALNDTVVGAEQVFGPEIFQLRDRLLRGDNSEAKFEIALQWLAGRIDPALTPPAELISVVDALQATPFDKVGPASKGYSKTQKHLIDQFKRYVGPTPKYLQRILRFNAVVQQLQAKESVVWADLAVSCGFSDQSHFVREYRLFSGYQPSEFVRKNHHNADATNFFPVDDGIEDQG